MHLPSHLQQQVVTQVVPPAEVTLPGASIGAATRPDGQRFITIQHPYFPNAVLIVPLDAVAAVRLAQAIGARVDDAVRDSRPVTMGQNPTPAASS